MVVGFIKIIIIYCSNRNLNNLNDFLQSKTMRYIPKTVCYIPKTVLSNIFFCQQAENTQFSNIDKRRYFCCFCGVQAKKD